MLWLEIAAPIRKPIVFGNFFYDCDACDYTLRFVRSDEVRVCPRCGRVNELSRAYQEFLEKERADNVRWLQAIREQIEKDEA